MKVNIFTKSLLVSLFSLVIHQASALDNDVDNLYPELMSFTQKSTVTKYGELSDYQNNTYYESRVVNAKVNDWRDVYNSVIKYMPKELVMVVEPGRQNSFNYFTDKSGEYWLNYTFFSHRPDVWYEIKNLKTGEVLQTGWSTVQMRKRHVNYEKPKTGERWYTESHIAVDQLEFKFDVEFHPITKMKNFVFFRVERKSIFAPKRNRGYIGQYWDYEQFKSDFTAMAGHR